MLHNRWSSSTMAFGFTAVPNLLVRINALKETAGPQRLTAAEMFVLLVLISYWIDDAIPPFPGINRIAQYTGLSSRHVRRIVKSLSQKGWVKITRLGAEGNRRNFYDLTPLVAHLSKSAENLEYSVNRAFQRKFTHMEMAEQMGLLSSSDPLEPRLPTVD